MLLFKIGNMADVSFFLLYSDTFYETMSLFYLSPLR